MRKQKYKAPDRATGSRAKAQHKADWFADSKAQKALAQVPRSAANWLADAAVFALDGDVFNARRAANRGWRLLRAEAHR
jgi:hypothetical protein